MNDWPRKAVARYGCTDCQWTANIYNTDPTAAGEMWDRHRLEKHPPPAMVTLRIEEPEPARP